MALSNAEKLRVQFRKSLRKGFVKNAELDPTPSSKVALEAEPNENFIVRVNSRKGGQYWFTDRRALFENSDLVREVFRYDAVQDTHWMFKNLWDRLKTDPTIGSQLKAENFDRLEIEVGDRVCVLDGLNQAYTPILNFLWWIAGTRSRKNTKTAVE
jgi:hypothetical protein